MAGMKIGNKLVTILQAHFLWEVLILMGEDELGHSEHISIKLWSRWSRRRKILSTASGESILDGGAWQFQGDDETCPSPSLNGTLTGAHKVLF